MRVCGDARNHLLGGSRKVSGAVVHLVDAIVVGHREVQVETTAALVTPGLAQEGGVLAAASNDVLDCGLEQEGAVGTV